ncbi:hypothetical protein MO867_22975, partial [Microbulbifer sp. OS29]
MEYGTHREGAITITALQDIFGLPDTVYSVEQPSTWQPPSRIPLAVTDQKLFEVSYRDLCLELSQTELTALDEDAGFIGALGARPNG